MAEAPEYTLITGQKPNGQCYTSFKTWDVWVRHLRIGMVQHRFPSPTRERGPWIAFIGPDGDSARNLAGLYDTEDLAAKAVFEEYLRRKEASR